MSIRLGRYHLATYTKKPISSRKPTIDETAEMNEGLDELCDLFADSRFDWFLVGGFGIDMHLGKFTRMHGDFDIEINQESIPFLITHMNERGYQLFRKLFSANIPLNRRAVLYEESNGFDCSLELGHKFRLLPCGDGRIIDGDKTLLSYIDVSFCRASNGCVEVGYKGNVVTSSMPYTTEDMVISRGNHRIRLRHPAYHAGLMKSYPCKKNKLNQRVIDELLATEAIA